MNTSSKPTEDTALLGDKPRRTRTRKQPADRIRYAQKQEVRRRIKIVDTAQLNQESHHVRTSPVKKTTTKKKDEYYGRDEYCLLEEALISSIQISEALEVEVNRNIANAYERHSLRAPIIAFVRYGAEFRFIRDFHQLSREYEVVHTKNPVTITKKQLSLDLLHHETEYKTIVSVILYMETLETPLTYVISRYPVTLTPRVPDLFLPMGGDEDAGGATTTTTTIVSGGATTTTTTTTKTCVAASSNTLTTTPSFIERLYMNCMRTAQAGYYYMLYVDLSLTKPKTL